MTQIKLLVTINLDPVPGWGQHANDFIEALKSGHGVGHYIETIEQVPDVCTEDNKSAIEAGFKVGEPLRNNGHCQQCFRTNAVVPRVTLTCRSCGYSPVGEPCVQSDETSEPNTDPS